MDQPQTSCVGIFTNVNGADDISPSTWSDAAKPLSFFIWITVFQTHGPILSSLIRPTCPLSILRFSSTQIQRHSCPRLPSSRPTLPLPSGNLCRDAEGAMEDDEEL